MEQALKRPQQKQETPEEASVSLLNESNALKADKKELKGRIYDLQFDGLSPEEFENAKTKISDDHQAMEDKFNDHRERVFKQLQSIKEREAEKKAENKAFIEQIKQTNQAVPADEIEKAKAVYASSMEKENTTFNADLTSKKEELASVKDEAAKQDKILRAEYKKIKQTPMRRSEKAEALDKSKGLIYNNSGSADLKELALTNEIKALQANHKKEVARIKNDLSLKTDHINTLIKNAKAQQKADLAPLKKKANELRADYGSVAPAYYRFGLYWRNWGIRYAKNAKTSFSSWDGFKNWFVHNAVYIIIIAMVIYTAIASPGWLSLATIVTIVKHTSSLLPLALGVAGTIILTGTDLSLGRIWGFTALFAGILLGFGSSNGVVFAWTENMPWIWILVVLLIVMAIGGLFGGLNGYFVAKFSIHPFIVTLATQLIIYGCILILGSSLNNLTVIYSPGNYIANAYTEFVSGGFYLGDVLVEWYNIFAIVLLIAIWFIWNKTKFGKSMFAVGCNPDAANVSGINVQKTILMTFVLAGICYGIAGFEYNPIYGGAQLSTGTGGELDPITAAVIGGVSFTGGIGKVSGVVLGCVLLKVIDSCLLTLGVSTAYINIFKGAIILIAVAFDMKKYIVKK